jgi:glycine C-acetyltransferase
MNEMIATQAHGADAALSAKVTGIFVHHTRYALEDLDPRGDFESDLGIDSVTLTEILADVYKAFGLSGTAPSGVLATLDQVVEHVRARLAEEGRATPVGDGVAGLALAPASGGAAALVLEMFRRQTGYGADQLSLDAHLESDLGIDSVTLLGVIDDLAAALGLPASGFPSKAQTIGELVAHVEKAGGVPAPRTEPAAAHAPSPASAPAAAEPPGEFLSFLGAKLAAGAAPADDELQRLSFSVIGLGQKDLKGLHDAVRRQYAAPETIRLSDCDTPEKLMNYVRAAEAHRVEKLGKAGDKAGERPAAQPASYPGPDGDKRTMKDFASIPSRDLFHKTREFRSFYRKKQQEQLYWYGMPLESRCENRAVIYDEITGRRREFLMFASNNYLGLANHPEVIESIAQAARQYGATNTGCRLIGGSNVLHMELERRLARLKGREACIVYPSGYSANLGCISALAGPNDLVFTDTINHMSIQDGCRLSGASRKIYQHTIESLEATLRKYADHPGGKLIVTDGVFSMHGDIVDLPRLVELAKRYGARVLVDDAHSTGVLGKTGSGTTEHFNMKGAADIEIGTMSKTLAGVGGFACADEDVVEYLRFYSNSYVFAATIPAPVAAGLLSSLDVMEREPQRLAKLWSNIHRLRGHLLAAGFDLERSESAILPVVVGDDRKALEFGRATRARGLFCQTVVYPGVSVGDARLRISVSSEHTDEDLDLAAEILVDAAKEIGLPVAV